MFASVDRQTGESANDWKSLALMGRKDNTRAAKEMPLIDRWVAEFSVDLVVGVWSGIQESGNFVVIRLLDTRPVKE